MCSIMEVMKKVSEGFNFEKGGEKGVEKGVGGI
jgi:hypothetical protein